MPKDTIEIYVDEPFASRLAKIRADQEKVESGPLFQISAGLVGTAALELVNITRKTVVIGSAIVHGAVHIN